MKFLPFFLLLFPLFLFSQKKNTVKLKTSVFGGYEDNLFKSPERLFNSEKNDYYNTDEIIVSENYLNVSYDVSYNRPLGKKTDLKLRHKNWYRAYFTHSQMNQSKIDLSALMKYKSGEKSIIETTYNAKHKNSIGTSVFGDELSRSFIYFHNEGNLAYLYDFSDSSKCRFEYSLLHKNYYKDTSISSLNSLSHKASVVWKRILNKGNRYKLHASYSLRSYGNYQAVDANGNADDSFPMRKFSYLKAGIESNTTFLKLFRFVPSAKVAQRIDAFQGYYNYFQYETGIRIRYIPEKIYITGSVKFKSTKYSNKTAPSYKEIDPQLQYSYLAYDFKFKYYVGTYLECVFDFSSDSRMTNTEREDITTRRPYNYYSAMLGVSYKFQSPKKATKKVYNLRL